MTDSEILFEIRQLATAAGDRMLLRRVDLALHEGEIVALTGRSGIGKTTLLRTLAGLTAPASGDIRLAGRPAHTLNWPAYRRRVVLIQQQPTLLDASVRDNLRRPFSYRTAAPRAINERRTEALLAQLGLSAAVLDQNARTLSVGEQQRVCLIRALLVAPQVLLLDEPTSAVDAEAARAIEAAVRDQVHRPQLAALVVTHDVAQARRWADRVIDIEPYCVPVAQSPLVGEGGSPHE